MNINPDYICPKCGNGDDKVHKPIYHMTCSCGHVYSQGSLSAFKAIQGYVSGDILSFRKLGDYKNKWGPSALSLDGELIGNMLCDLMHLCQENGIDFEKQLSYGKYHFSCEEIRAKDGRVEKLNLDGV